MSIKRKREAHDDSSEANVSKKIQTSEERNIYSSTSKHPPFVEKPTGDELKREVALYEKLASEDESERLDAADAIVSGLIGGNETTESTLLRHLERRLFRGLASGRKGARLGYSVVLTEILSQLFKPGDNPSGEKYNNLQFDKIFLLLKIKTKPEGDLNGQEVKDHALGFLFGLQCFVRARILLLDSERWKLVLQEIFGLARKKPWIKEECGWMIVEALEQMDQDQAKLTLQSLYDEGFSKSPEGVGIWIVARKKFPPIIFESLPKVWGQSANPLEHLKSLAKVLKESSEPDKSAQNSKETQHNQQKNQTGNWNAKLHFTWNIILEQFAARFEEVDNHCEDNFQKFWKVVVDDTLFASNASRERKFWGFLLFQKVLQSARTYRSAISSIFSPNLMRCLINHSQDKDRFLNRAADKSLKFVLTAVKINLEILPDVLYSLIGKNGTYNFDKVTKTKTISQLLDLVSEVDFQMVIFRLEDLATKVSGDDESIVVKEAESRRLMLADYLLQMVRKPISEKSEESMKTIRNAILLALARFAYSEINEANPTISDKTRVLFQSRLASAFTYLFTGLEDYRYPCDLLKNLEPTAVKMDPELENVHGSAISTMHKILKKLKKASNDARAPLQAMGLLYALIIFQLYNGESEAVTCLDELDLCYQKLVKKKSEEFEKSETSEVLVELLLSFVSRPSALLRRVTQLVFGAFVSSITKGGLELITNVLTTSESVRGQQELFDQDDDDALEIGSEENDLDSDVEIVDIGIEGSTHADSSSDEEEISSGEEDSSSETGEETEEKSISNDLENERLNLALVNILKTNPDASSADDDEDMTDSEMMALDSKLEEIFSQRKAAPNKKKEQKDAVENITNFKSRVLDLLEIYVKKQSHDELAFELLLPLLALIRTTKIKKLADKSHAVINTFARTYKSHPNSQMTINPTLRIELLKRVHEAARTNSSHAFCKAASSASLLIVSSMFRVDTGLLRDAANVYCDTQLKWVWGQAKMQAAFFTEWINWCQSHVSKD
ncbi:hypothetical protein K3495_g9372 [Podosphaera aphanis]|nr:hypothetical protein K3495_g9372 [Podosphaera aphanis]